MKPKFGNTTIHRFHHHHSTTTTIKCFVMRAAGSVDYAGPALPGGNRLWWAMEKPEILGIISEIFVYNED